MKITDEAVEAGTKACRDITFNALTMDECRDAVRKSLEAALPHLTQGGAGVSEGALMKLMSYGTRLNDGRNDGTLFRFEGGGYFFLADQDALSPAPVGVTGRNFNLGDRVTKTKGSSWSGLVVGFYSTRLTPIGYAVESENEPGSVQIYPESALASHEPAPHSVCEKCHGHGGWNTAGDEIAHGVRETVWILCPDCEPGYALTACQQEVERLRKEIEAAKNDLRGFLTTFVREHFPENKIWEPFPDLLGMLSQMDNASTIARDYAARIRELEKAMERIADYPSSGSGACPGIARAALGGQSNE